MDQPPPPPPPHGENPKTTAGGSSGLPHGNYDIFIIPPHSSGGGFLYLPSLRPQLNSFFAGIVTALLSVWVWFAVQPILKAWVQGVSQSGSAFGMVLLVAATGLAGWIYGRTDLNIGGGGFGSPPYGPHPGPGPGANGWCSAKPWTRSCRSTRTPSTSTRSSIRTC